MDRKKIGLISDPALIEGYKGGDNECLGELYNRYYSKVYYRCLFFLKDPDEAFDASHNILLRIFEKIDLFNHRSKFSTWLFSVTTNYCLDYIRKQKSDLLKANAMKNEISNLEVLYLNEVEQEDLEFIIRILMKNLSEEERYLLDQKYNKGCSIKDLQKKFNLSSSAIKMRLMRSREKLLHQYWLHNNQYLVA